MALLKSARRRPLQLPPLDFNEAKKPQGSAEAFKTNGPYLHIQANTVLSRCLLRFISKTTHHRLCYNLQLILFSSRWIINLTLRAGPF